MNGDSQFSLDPSGHAKLSGALTLDTVAAIYREAETAAGQGRPISDLDLGMVSHVDSSGLALLLEWQADAVRNGRSLKIRNAPADLLSLASLCEAADLLAIDGRNLANGKPAMPTSPDHHSSP